MSNILGGAGSAGDDDFNDLENIAALPGVGDNNINNRKPNIIKAPANNDPVRMSEVLA